MTNIAVKAARNAGNLIMRYVDRVETLNIDVKSANDFVTEVDILAEQEIIKTIQKAYPHHSFMGEESGITKGDDYVWIIDPLDGTTNFIHQFPHFAVSIALMYQDKLMHGVVYDPSRQELFTATRGGGAQLNGKRIRVSKTNGFKDALIGTGFPFRMQEHLPAYLEMFKVVHNATAGIRRAGSAALDLAYVAAGRMDAFWEICLKPWDIAAGALLVEEAGGIVSDLAGGQDYLNTGNIITGGSKTHRALLQAIQPFLNDALKK